MNTQIIKDEAKDALVGSRLMMLLVLIVFSAINLVLERFYIGLLLLPIFTAGFYLVNKELLLDGRVDFGKLFYYFRNLKHALKLFGVTILTALIVTLGCLLFIIPGIIFSFRYSQALLIMADNPDIGIIEAMIESKELMYGHKMEYFLFGLSFIGHILLGIITLGIYLLYIMPYIVASNYNYYLHLTHQNEDDDTTYEY